MIKRITITNYMAHKHTTLELAPEVTVITGPNNAGKSAIVEAIRSIAQNPPYRHAIRHGAKSAVVRAEIESGEIIEWTRSEKSAVYRILRPSSTPQEDPTPEPDRPPDASYTAETYAKFGRTPPDDVQNLLRLDVVETETGPVDIHIGNQRRPIFLIDQAGSQAASFFAASTEAEYLLKMQQALKRRTDAAKAKRKEVLSEVSKAEKELQRYEPLDSLEAVLGRAEELYAAVRTAEKQIPMMADHLTTLTEMNRRSALQARCTSILAKLCPAPELQPQAPLETLTRELQERLRLLDHRRVRGGLLAQLQATPVPYGLQPLQELVHTLSAAHRGQYSAACRGRILRNTMAPPEFKDTAPLEDMLVALEAATSRLHKTEARNTALVILDIPPALWDVQPLEALSENLSRTLFRLAKNELHSRALAPREPPPLLHTSLHEMEALTNALADMQERAIGLDHLLQDQEEAILFKRGEIQSTLERAGECPLCGHPMDLDHFLGGAGHAP